MLPTVLIVDDNKVFRSNLEKFLRREGHEVSVAGSGKEGYKLIKDTTPDVVLLDLRLPDVDFEGNQNEEVGLRLLRKLKDENEECKIIMMTAFSSVKSAIQAMKMGATEYLTKPFDLDELKITIDRIFENEKLRREVEYLRQKDKYGMEFVVGKSKKMEQVYDIVEKVAASDTTTVLIQGESGTGKELIANMVHSQSPRSDNAFLEINCAAIPENLLESELFGYEAGAFTGAQKRKLGLLELADGGTVLLDEIGEMSPAMQVKVLRVLETQKFKRVGGTKDIYVNIRIVAATNRDLQEEVKKENFRKDLFYRLNVMPIKLPPLRERREDILLVARAFVEERKKAMNKDIKGFSEDAKELLLKYPWPGNIRELKNVIERAVILTTGDEILPENLFLEMPSEYDMNMEDTSAVNINLPKEGMPFSQLLTLAERQIIQQALDLAEGNQVKASKLVHMSRQSFRYRMNKLGF